MFADGTFVSGQGGWGALSWYLFKIDSDGNNELPAKADGTLVAGSFGVGFACIPDDCYAFEVRTHRIIFNFLLCEKVTPHFFVKQINNR